SPARLSILQSIEQPKGAPSQCGGVGPNFRSLREPQFQPGKQDSPFQNLSGEGRSRISVRPKWRDGILPRLRYVKTSVGKFRPPPPKQIWAGATGGARRRPRTNSNVEPGKARRWGSAQPYRSQRSGGRPHRGG